MCLSPRIIINPSFVKLSSFGKYPFVHLCSRDLMYRRNAFDEFDYKTFSWRRNGVTKDNINEFYAYNLDGETLPLYISVPCGKCSVCIMQKRSQIKSRLILEQYSHGDTPPLFLTLTYAPQFLPDDGVCVSDVQLFMKRLRSFIDYHYHSSFKFRYVCFSEYSPEKGRAHYHLLLFGIKFGSPRDVLKFESDIADCWQKGFVYARVCDYGCFNYVSKYVCKGSNVPYGKNPNFRLSSRGNGGLGTHAFNDESLYLQLIQNPHPLVTVKILGKSFTVFIPKSLRERLFRSPRQFVPRKIQDSYKKFCVKSMLLKVLMDDYPEFCSHASHFLKIKNVELPSMSCIVPRSIYDKYAALEFHSFDEKIPYYFRSDSVCNPKVWPDLIDEYVTLYNTLNDYELDFGKMFDFSYLRSKIYESWKLSLIKFVEKQPDRDPLLASEFNAILVESQKCNHGS